MALVRTGFPDRPRERAQKSMIVYVALIYPLFLAIALVGRVMPVTKPRHISAMPRQSVFSEAADRTQSVVPWFFVHG